jgi:aminomethyltransferase
MDLMTEAEVSYHAIRNSVAFAEEPELHCLKLTGSQAFDALDVVCPCDIFLQDGQMKHTLLLDDKGIPFADVYVCREGENAYLLGYGPNADKIVAWITGHVPGIADFSIINLSKSHDSLALDGPYAWELCAEVFGPDVLGLPYLGMRVLDEMLVFRAGRTGEYGYHLLVPSDEKNTWVENLFTTGEAFEMVCADESVRSQCVLENFFFDIDREGQYRLTPLELQLQWRLSSQKTAYPGAEAIASLRQSGWTRRLTCFTTPDFVNPDAAITCDGEMVGRVLVSGYSPMRGDYVGKALLHQPYWYAGLDAFRVGDCPLKTISAPAINNLSLKVSPYRHSFHTQEEDLT